MEVSFPIRFIADEEFIRDILKDKLFAAKTLMKLSFIHKNSKLYPMSHNLISDECFKKAIKEKQIRGQALLGALHPEPWGEFVAIEKDQESKVIRWAINEATKKPYLIVILTSKESQEKYIKNKHYSNDLVKAAVKIFSGDSAQKVIDLVMNYQQ